MEVTQKTSSAKGLEELPPTQFELGLIAKEIGFVLTQLDAFNAIFAAQQNSKNPSKFELPLMIQWLCDNIPKFRKIGSDGNNFRGTRNSLPPFASKTTFGGHGFGGAVGSLEHETAKKLCSPI